MRARPANARLTASNAAVLLVLLAAEGVTILRVRELVTPHVFIGTVLVLPLLLRLLGPAVVILTVVLLASGVGCSWRALRGCRCCSRCTRRASCCGSAP